VAANGPKPQLAASAPVVGDQPAGHLLGAFGRQEVTLRGGNDGALHQDVPGAGELLCVAQAGFFGQRLEMAADPGQVADAGFPQRMLGAHFKEYVDESAGLEIITLEPVSKHVEDGQEAFLRSVAPAPGFGDDEVHGPHLVAKGEEGKNERIFGGEVPIEGGFCHPGSLDQLVDADVADAAAGEELVGGGQYPVQGFVLTGTYPLGQQCALF